MQRPAQFARHSAYRQSYEDPGEPRLIVDRDALLERHPGLAPISHRLAPLMRRLFSPDADKSDIAAVLVEGVSALTLSEALVSVMEATAQDLRRRGERDEDRAGILDEMGARCSELINQIQDHAYESALESFVGKISRPSGAYAPEKSSMWGAKRHRTHCAPNVSLEDIREENEAIDEAFVRIADLVGLTWAERSILLGATKNLSRVILALEIVAAALNLCGAPKATLDWLRVEVAQSPFNGRSPLGMIAADGQLGAEIVSLVLRARRESY